MGGKVRSGYTIITGVVTEDVKREIIARVEKGEFKNISRAVGIILEKALKDRNEKHLDAVKEDCDCRVNEYHDDKVE